MWVRAPTDYMKNRHRPKKNGSWHCSNHPIPIGGKVTKEHFEQMEDL